MTGATYRSRRFASSDGGAPQGSVPKPLRPDAQASLDAADLVDKWNVQVSVGAMSNAMDPMVWGQLFYLYQVRAPHRTCLGGP